MKLTELKINKSPFLEAMSPFYTKHDLCYVSFGKEGEEPIAIDCLGGAIRIDVDRGGKVLTTSLPSYTSPATETVVVTDISGILSASQPFHAVMGFRHLFDAIKSQQSEDILCDVTRDSVEFPGGGIPLKTVVRPHIPNGEWTHVARVRNLKRSINHVIYARDRIGEAEPINRILLDFKHSIAVARDTYRMAESILDADIDVPVGIALDWRAADIASHFNDVDIFLCDDFIKIVSGRYTVYAVNAKYVNYAKAHFTAEHISQDKKLLMDSITAAKKKKLERYTITIGNADIDVKVVYLLEAVKNISSRKGPISLSVDPNSNILKIFSDMDTAYIAHWRR